MPKHKPSRMLPVLLLAALLLCASCGAAAAPPAVDPPPVPTPTPTPTQTRTVPTFITYDQTEPVLFAAGPAADLTIGFQLQPATDYGQLLHYRDFTSGAYGLVTAEGQAVTLFGSYYKSIERPSYQIPYNDYERVVAPILLLEEAPEPSDYVGVAGQYNPAANRYRVAALDGSWITSGLYNSARAMEDGVYLVKQDGSQLFVEWDGTVRWQNREPRISNANGGGGSSYFFSRFNRGIILNAQYEPYENCLIEPQTGAITWLGEAAPSQPFNGGPLAPAGSDQYHEAGGQSQQLFGYLDQGGAWQIAPQYLYADLFHRGLALVQAPDGPYRVIDEANRTVYQCSGEAQWADSLLWAEGAAYFGMRENASGEQHIITDYYTSDAGPLPFNPVGRTALRVSSHYKTDALLFDNPDGKGKLLLRGATACALPALDYCTLQYDLVIGDTWTENGYQAQLLQWPSGEALIPPGTYESILASSDLDGNGFFLAGQTPDRRTDFFDATGQVFFSCPSDDWFQAHLFGELTLFVSGRRLQAYDRQQTLLWELEL